MSQPQENSQKLALEVFIEAPAEQCDLIVQEALDSDKIAFRSETTKDDHDGHLISRAIALNSSLGELYGHVAVIEIVRSNEEETLIQFTERIHEPASFMIRRKLAQGAANRMAGELPQNEWIPEPNQLTKAIVVIRSKFQQAHLWPLSE